MFQNPTRGRQARNFTTNVPKILDLKSSSEQIVIFRKLTLGAPECTVTYHTIVQDRGRSPCSFVLSRCITKPSAFNRNDNKVNNTQELQGKPGKWAQHDIADEEGRLCWKRFCQVASNLNRFLSKFLHFWQSCWPSRKKQELINNL